VSVDPSYYPDKNQVVKNLKLTLSSQKVNWPCVIEPKGWNSVARRFNLDGYGLSLVGPDGIVRGVDLQVNDVKRLLSSLLSSKK
jgi:hypothetical protein